MNKLTLDIEKLSVDSFEAGMAADEDCPGASATASEARPCAG
jgi:hypothetical protein